MARSFDDLVAWQKARELTKLIYEVTKRDQFSRAFRLVSQIRAASTSIMSNIAEGFERGNRAEFHQSLVVAKGEAGEVRSQLYVAFDAEYLDEEIFIQLKAHCMELSRVIEGLRSQVESQRRSGNRRETAGAPV